MGERKRQCQSWEGRGQGRRLTNGSRQVVSVQRLDILDLERIDVKVVHPQQRNGVLRARRKREYESVRDPNAQQRKRAEAELTATSNPSANALRKSAAFWICPTSCVCLLVCGGRR